MAESHQSTQLPEVDSDGMSRPMALRILKVSDQTQYSVSASELPLPGIQHKQLLETILNCVSASIFVNQSLIMKYHCHVGFFTGYFIVFCHTRFMAAKVRISKRTPKFFENF